MSAPYDDNETKAWIGSVKGGALEQLRKGRVTMVLDNDTKKMIGDVKLVIRIQKELSAELGKEPTDAEIAERSSLSTERVTEIRTTSKPPIILE